MKLMNLVGELENNIGFGEYEIQGY